MEAFLLVLRILKNRGYELVLTHTKYAELLDAQLSEVNAEVVTFHLVPLRGPRVASLRRKVAFYLILFILKDAFYKQVCWEYG